MADPDNTLSSGNPEGGAFRPDYPPPPERAHPQDVPVPDVVVAWSALPVVSPWSAGSGKGAAIAYLHDDIAVTLSGITAAEQAILDTARTMVVPHYTALKNLVMSTKDYIWGQHIDILDIPGGDTSNNDGTANAALFSPAPIREMAQKWAADANPAQDQLLAAVANALETVGQFVAALSDAANTYASADNNSFFPVPGQAAKATD
ncbi:MAG: hypothetical protein ACJ786_42105 [Catenulispora sp.]